MVRMVANATIFLLAAVMLLYIGDWAVWRVRVAHGGGMGSVKVGILQVAEMKGNKEEYFPDGQEVVQCSKSLFPQSGAGACWWVEQHRTVFEQ
jgi:hypothetical protein